MNKLLMMITACLIAGSVQAASIQWGSAGAVYFGETTSTVANGYSTSAYLVYLGEVGTASWESVDYISVASGLGVEGTDYIGAKAANPLGAVATQPAYIVGWNDTISTSTDTFQPNVSSFGMIFKTQQGTGDIYYNLSDIYTVGGVGTPVGSETFTFAESIPSNPDPAAQGWQPVPEPSTILLGLAGAGALLARRRKSSKKA